MSQNQNGIASGFSTLLPVLIGKKVSAGRTQSTVLQGGPFARGQPFVDIEL